MSVDTVNECLTKVRLLTHKRKDFWSEEGYQLRTTLLDCMRQFLMDDDTPGFIAYTQARLGRYPDTMQGILEDLFAEVCGDERACWEEFEAKLLEQ